MNTTAHACYSFLIYTLILQLGWGVWSSGLMVFFALLAGISPDFDGIYHVVFKRGNANDQNFQHHLYYWTHWPSSYFPLVVAFVLALVFNFYPQYFLIPLVGVYSHMLFDSTSCGDGLMPTMSVWKKKRGEFGKFYNFDARKTDGYHGSYWTARYRQTKYFILENIAAGGVCTILIFLIIDHGFDLWFGFSLLGVIGSVILGLKGVDPKYKQEPPQGRYADYHVYPPYVAWYQKKYGTIPPKKYQ